MPAIALDPDRSIDQYYQKHFDLEQGIPQLSVTAITQDKKGFLWIATQNGAARFDGHSFVAFNTRNTPGMASDVIADIEIDNSGKIWLLTLSGLVQLNGHQARPIDVEQASLIAPHDLDINSLGQFVAAGNGLFRFDKGQLHPWLINESCYVIKTATNSLVVGGRGKIFYIRHEKLSTHLLPREYKDAVVNDLVLYQGAWYIGTDLGLIKFDGRSFTSLSGDSAKKHSPVNRLYLDENNMLWVAARDSLYRIQNDRVVAHDPQPMLPKITSFFRDREGSLWLGSEDRGLFQLWNSWAARYGKRQGLQEELVWSLASQTNGYLLVGTDKGLYRLGKQGFELIKLPKPLAARSFYSLFVDTDQSIWAGTKNGAVHLSGNGAPESLSKVLLEGRQINGIFRGNKNEIYLLSSEGVFTLPDSQNSKPVPLNSVDGTAPHLTFRAGAFFKNRGYFASQKGLFRLDDSNTLSLVETIPDNYFYTSIFSTNDWLIVGSYSHGLWLFDGEQWKNLDTSNGTLFNNVFSMQVKPPFFYVSGFDGVYRISLTELANFVAGQIDRVNAEPILDDQGNLPGSQKARCCNGAGHSKSALYADNLWFPTRAGVLKLEPEKIIRNQVLISTEILQLKSSEKTWDLYFEQAQNYYFEQRNISVTYAAITALNEGLVKYRYRLIKLPATDQVPWIEADGRREAFFTNLDGGRYRFEVKASNNSGLWPHLPNSVEFIVANRWYEYWWVKLALVALMLLIVYLVYRFEHKRAERKEIKLQKLINEKTGELQSTNARLEKAVRQLEFYSFTDSLTGTNNRRYIEQQVPSDIAHYLRHSDEKSGPSALAFLLVDIDYFKKVNDQYGHATGDEVLRQMAALLRAGIRDGDYLIRWGGEEFLIVLRPEHAISIEQVCARLIERIRRREFYGVRGEKLHMTISLGFCIYPLRPELVSLWSWKDAVEMADKALYLAKNNGRDTWFGYQLTDDHLDSQSIVVIKQGILEQNPDLFQLVRADHMNNT